MSDPDAHHARAALAKLDCLVVQEIFLTETCYHADVILPATAWPEKSGTVTNTDRMVQMGRPALTPPGEAKEDWQILVAVARSLGLPMAYETSNDVRRALAAAMPGSAYAEADNMVFTRPLAARSWLQASNPSERWKWDFMFQDLPPVKGHNVQMEGLFVAGQPYIPLKQVDK
jgi:predicted molibdopterin-dependent oxidoreductase YjgC